MPTIAWPNGVAIRMFFNDHAPAHFHASYGRHEAKFEIETARLLKGQPAGASTPARRAVGETVS